MIIYREGDKSKGPCEKCRKLVSTTFRYAPLKFSGMIIPEVLQDFCDECGSAVSIPQQSSFRIREFRERCTHSMELRIPPHYTDILVAIGSVSKTSHKPNYLCRVIAELYLARAEKPEGREIRERILSALDDELAKGKSKDRLSCCFPDTTYAVLRSMAAGAKKNSSSIIRGIIVAAKYDILDKKDSSLAKEFQELAASRS